MEQAIVLKLTSARTALRQAVTRIQRLTAAPDRLRRRRWAADRRAAPEGIRGRALSEPELADNGFSLCSLDGTQTDRLLAAWADLKSAHSRRQDNPARPRSTGKAFFEEMLSQDDLCEFPPFLETALDERVLGSVMLSMGMLPHLESIDVLRSNPVGDSLTASQLWHYDVNDQRIIKLFVYLEDCGPENGPFTYIAAGPSMRVSGLLGHYVNDERIAAHVPRDEWRVVEGPAGTAFLIDTGRCYHFGSRSRRPRVAYVATYSSGLRFMPRSRTWGDMVSRNRLELSDLQRAVCGIAR